MSLTSFGQRIVVKNPSTFNYIAYVTENTVSNGVFVVSLHGTGEGGPIDGSLITKVETYGYAKRWNNGERFPFTLIVPQGIKNPGDDVSSYKNVMNNIEAELLRLGAKKIIYMGWSHGAMQAIATLGMIEVNNMFTQSKITQVDAVISFAGKGSGNTIYANCKDVPFILVHGDNDTSLNKVQGSISFYNGIKAACPNRKSLLELHVIPGGSHSDAMNRGYNPTDPIGKKVYELILSFIPSEPTEPVKEAIKEQYIENGKLVTIGTNGTKIVN